MRCIGILAFVFNVCVLSVVASNTTLPGLDARYALVIPIDQIRSPPNCTSYVFSRRKTTLSSDDLDQPPVPLWALGVSQFRLLLQFVCAFLISLKQRVEHRRTVPSQLVILWRAVVVQRMHFVMMERPFSTDATIVNQWPAYMWG